MNDNEINYNLVIGENGKLMIKNNRSFTFKEVVGLRPSTDISSEDAYFNFLSEIAEENYCGAIVFTFKY